MKADEIFTDMKEIIESIKIGSERINKIVTNLKDFARIEDETESQAVDINEVVSASMMIIGAQARKSVGKININLAEGLPEVEGNINRIEQVIVNLISNALHAIPDKETGILNITTRHIKSINSVLIEVEDNGKGIEKDIRPVFYNPENRRGNRYRIVCFK